MIIQGGRTILVRVGGAEPVGDPGEDDLVVLADAIAEEAHRGQLDKQGLPYVQHVRAVAEIVRHRGRYAVAVALLHDVLEDTPLVYGDLIARGVPRRVADAVQAMTRPDDEPYEDFITRIIEFGGLAVIGKWGDVGHHISRLHEIADESERARLAGKYLPARLRLEAAMDRGGA